MLPLPRRLFAGLAVLFAVLLLPVALGAQWVTSTVESDQAWADATGPLADDPDFRDSLSAQMAESLMAQVSGSGWVGEEGTAGDRLARRAVTAAVDAVVGSERFPVMWRATTRAMHSDLMALLEQDAPARDTTEDSVRVPVPALTAAVAEELRDRGLGPVADRVAELDVEVPVAGVTLDRARTAWGTVGAVSTWTPWVVLALVVLALLVAPRWGTVVALGLGTVLAGVVVWVGLDRLPGWAEGAPGQDVWSASALETAVRVAGAPLENSAVACLVIGAVIALVGVVAMSARRRRPRTTTA